MFYMAKGHRTDAAAKLGGLVNEVSFCREKQKLEDMSEYTLEAK